MATATPIVKKKGKSVDKWKLKKYYDIVAPDIFQEKIIGQTVAEDDARLMNRIINLSLTEMTGVYDELNLYTMVKLRVVDIKGQHAFTKLAGHELSRSYIRTLAMRRRSVIDPVVDVKTKDGTIVRIKGLIVAAERISGAQKTALHNLFISEMNAIAAEKTMNEIMNDILFDKVSMQYGMKAKKIVPLRGVKIKKTEIKVPITKVEKQ